MSVRGGMQPHFLPRGAGWRLPVVCAGICVLLQLTAWIIGGMSASRQGDAAALQQQITALALPQGKSWRELEQAKMDDREKQVQELRTRYTRSEPESLSWLALRQKQEDIEKLLRSRAKEAKVELPEKLEFPNGPDKEGRSTAGDDAGEALQASELAAEGLLLWLQQGGVTVERLGAGLHDGRPAAHLEGTLPGRGLGPFLNTLKRSGLTPLKIEIKRGEGISPPVALKLDLICPEVATGAAGAPKAANTTLPAAQGTP